VFFRFNLTSVTGRNFVLAMNDGGDGTNTSPYGSNPTMSLWVNNGFLEVHYGGASFAGSTKVTDTLYPVEAGTTYCCEVGVVRNTIPNGEIRVYLEGDQVFNITGVQTASGAGTFIGKVWWGHFLYDGVTVTAGSGMDASGFVIRTDADVLTDADFFVEQNVTPHISAIRAVSQGNYSDLAADPTLIDETDFTEAGDAITYAGGAKPQQSWIGTASLPIAAAGGTVLGLVTRVVASDGSLVADFVRGHVQQFIRDGGVDYDSPDNATAVNQNANYLTGAPAVLPLWWASSRYWLTDPATAAAWTPGALEGMEWGLRLISGWNTSPTPTWAGEENSGPMDVAHVVGEVLWTTEGYCGSVPIDVECVPPPVAGPCDILSDAWFVDAAKRYDGRDEDGSAASFEDIGNGTDSGDVVGINVDILATFEASDVGRRIRLTIAGVGYDATVTTVIGTRGIEVTLLQNVPLAAVGVATTAWAFVVNTLDIPWLEGEDVNVLADGIPRYTDALKPPTKYSVVGGVLTLDAYYGVIIAGLPRVSDMELLDRDEAAAAPFRDRKKITARAGVLVEFTRGFDIGEGEADLARWVTKPLTEYPNENPISLPTKTVVVNVPARWDIPGRLLIRQVEPLPISVLAIIAESATGGRASV